jgi:sortase A
LYGYMWWQERQIGESTSEKPVQMVEAAVETSEEKEDPVLYPVRPKPNEKIGELEIPRIDATLPIIEGADPEQLAKGVGHFRNSYLPGESNFCLLSGHRDTVFRRIGEVKKGDQIIAHTSAGRFVYVVERTKIVDADDESVIRPTDEAILALSTCYPFNYIGPAPKRYVIFCKLAPEAAPDPAISEDSTPPTQEDMDQSQTTAEEFVFLLDRDENQNILKKKARYMTVLPDMKVEQVESRSGEITWDIEAKVFHSDGNMKGDTYRTTFRVVTVKEDDTWHVKNAQVLKEEKL